MKKLKSFSVKSMAALSREEMAQINGGDFTVYDCNENNGGKTCAYAFEGNSVILGSCYVSSTTTEDGFVYTYECVAKA
ncbi:MAG: hypothetical protein NC113_05075 [Bacteroides sp.]|nr:hypothetical protein [Bacteroides sp.]MCM1447581.1 hypothetical protein [Bacteroides sp.]